jgi:hypothetical protein
MKSHEENVIKKTMPRNTNSDLSSLIECIRLDGVTRQLNTKLRGLAMWVIHAGGLFFAIS